MKLIRKITVEGLLVGIFVLVSVGLFVWYNASKPRIVILHSFEENDPWVQDINTGIRRVLQDRSMYRLHWYYMDSKSQNSVQGLAAAGTNARAAIDKINPDILIALDDDAQQYAARYYINHPHVKVVFGGIDHDPGDYHYDLANNVTGVVERLPLAAIREALLAIPRFQKLQRPFRLGLLSDASGSVLGEAQQWENFDWGPVEVVPPQQAANWDEWQEKLDILGLQADVIVLSGYRTIRRTEGGLKPIPADQIVQWTEAHSAVPVISYQGQFAHEGGMLTIGTSPLEQGEDAASMALEILRDGHDPSQIPVRYSRQFVVGMKQSVMERRGIVLPKVYEVAARAAGRYYP